MVNEWDDWLKGKRRGSLMFPDPHPSPFKSTLFAQHELPGRIRVRNQKGLVSEKALAYLGWSKHKLTSLLRYIQENQLTMGKIFMQMSDGTQVSLKESEGNTRIDIMSPEEVKAKKEKKRKQREYITTYPAPVLCCQTFLPGTGNYYYNSVPELFLVMPYFKNISYIIEPTKPEDPSEKLYRTYVKYNPDDIYGMWKGECRFDRDNTMNPFDLSIPRNERRKVKIRELVNISDINQSQSDLTWDSSGTSNYVWNPSETADPRELIYTDNSTYNITAFGNIIETTSSMHEGHDWSHKVGVDYVKDNATALSQGVYTDMASIRIITNPEISESFKSSSDVYAYVVRHRTRDNFQEGVTVWSNGPYMDTNNKVSEYAEYLLVVHTPKYNKESSLWGLNKLCYETDTLYYADVKIYNFHGEPVFLLCWMPSFTGDPYDSKIRYMMIYQDKTYESERYTRIGTTEYPHIVYTGGNQPYYCSGYMRLVEIEEKVIIEEEA